VDGGLHFHRRFSILSAPLLTAAAAAQRTSACGWESRQSAPLHHPVRLAEEEAVLISSAVDAWILVSGEGTHFPVSMTIFISHRQRAGACEALDILIGAWTRNPSVTRGIFSAVRSGSCPETGPAATPSRLCRGREPGNIYRHGAARTWHSRPRPCPAHGGAAGKCRQLLGGWAHSQA
jgi:hypothetical protein